jgi:hypothetical protein
LEDHQESFLGTGEAKRGSPENYSFQGINRQNHRKTGGIPYPV